MPSPNENWWPRLLQHHSLLYCPSLYISIYKILDTHLRLSSVSDGRLFLNRNFQNDFMLSGSSPSPVVEQTKTAHVSLINSKTLYSSKAWTVDLKKNLFDSLQILSARSCALPVCDPYKITILSLAKVIVQHWNLVKNIPIKNKSNQ